MSFLLLRHCQKDTLNPLETQLGAQSTLAMMGGNAKADNDSDDEHEQHPWGACSGHGTGQDNGRVVFGRWPRHCHCPNPINFIKKQPVISQIQLISTKNRPKSMPAGVHMRTHTHPWGRLQHPWGRLHLRPLGAILGCPEAVGRPKARFGGAS